MSALRILVFALGLLICSAATAETLGDLIRCETGGFPTRATESVHLHLTDLDHAVAEREHFLDETSAIRQATLIQPTPLLLPRTEVTPSLEVGAAVGVAGGAASVSLTTRLFGSGLVERSNLRQAKYGVASLSVDRVPGAEAAPLTTTDLGDLLKKSSTALSIKTQSRTPIVNDSRVRSSRIGTLAASGSHWVAARADLDTALSKIDSRLVQDVIVVPGPYSSVYGPGFNFVDFKLLPSPRFERGRELRGMSSFEHKANGNQWLGQQSLAYGDRDWGVRGTYTHRRGDDYRDGDGMPVASGYKSRLTTIAAGRNVDDARSIEASLLRLDQTDVEFPGFVFDINTLVTDGYEVTYVNDEVAVGDQIETEIWYNRTRFDGDSDNPEKDRQFPFLTFVDFQGTTDADVMSTGYRRATTWGRDDEAFRLTVGHDLRLVKQEINEIFNTLLLNTPIRVFGEAPLPRSFNVNPGLFVEYSETFCRDYTFQSGARLDYVQTDITEDVSNLQDVALTGQNYENAIGTEQKQTDRFLGSIYGRLQRRLSPELITSISLGYAERAPTLTELYGVGQLLLLVQNGLNTVTGDPRLKDEKLLQTDITIDYQSRSVRAGARGYLGWAFDYITFENTGTVVFGGQVVQTNLRAVNTSLATLVGMESYLEFNPEGKAVPFATLRAQDGRDRTRNGDFATRAANTFFPSARIDGLPRGAFSGVAGNDSESLPGIAPPEARLGIRFRDDARRPDWTVEISARVVDNQDRVATSLLEFATPGFTTWDLRGVWQPRKWESISLYSGLENFTDKTYREHLDFRSRAGIDVFQPGVNFYVAADVTY